MNEDEAYWIAQLEQDLDALGHAFERLEQAPAANRTDLGLQRDREGARRDFDTATARAQADLAKLTKSLAAGKD